MGTAKLTLPDGREIDLPVLQVGTASLQYGEEEHFDGLNLEPLRRTQLGASLWM